MDAPNSLSQDGEIRKIICGLAGLLVSSTAFSAGTASVQENAVQALQPVCAISSIRIDGNMLEISSPPPSVQAVVRQISAIAGVMANFETALTKSLEGRLAIATIREEKRLIVYDASVYKPTDTQITWQHVGVLAHEIGHHLAGHTAIRSSDPHVQELEADRFSGYASAMLGGTLGQALSFTDKFSDEDSSTHPGGSRRRIAITEGWRQGETVKRLGGPFCTPQWIGEKLLLGGQECRLARCCEGNSARVLLACRRDGSNWEWRQWRHWGDVSVNGETVQ